MSDTIDVSGLSPEAIRTVEALVVSLRGRETETPERRDPQSWSKALREWAASHAKRDIVIDDSRESIYEGRGE